MTTPPPPAPQLGRLPNRILAVTLVVSVAVGFYLLLQNHDVFFVWLLLAAASAFGLVALPAVLFMVYTRRERALKLTRTMRTAVLFSALCLIVTGAWVAYWMWPGLWTAPAVLLAGCGGLVTARAWRAPAAALPGTGPRLAYGGSSVAGALFLLLTLVSVPKFACGCGEPAHHAILNGELRTLALVQDAYLLDHRRFASSGAALDSVYRPTDRVHVTVLGNDSSWHAFATYPNRSGVCGVWVGTPPSDGMRGAPEGQPACFTP